MPAVELLFPVSQGLRQTCVNDSYIVSTIRLNEDMARLDALVQTLAELLDDHSRADLSTPGAYETMVFPGNNEDGVTDWTELDFRRYDSEDDAYDGHDEMVAKWLEMPLGLGT